jgi:P pilus assembly chaperone PapD
MRATTIGLLVAAFLAGNSRTSSGQGVLIAPQSIFVDAGSRTAAFTVANPSRDRVEVMVSTLYGIPATDSAGQMYLQTFAPVPANQPSAANWIEAYPRQFVLDPGSRRVVRLLVNPPSGTPDGEYWSRVVVASRGAAQAVLVSGAPEAVNVALALEVRSVIPLLFRKGRVETSVTMGELTATVQPDSLETRVELARGGNAAWIGTLRATLADQTGEIRSSAELPLGVYYQLRPRLRLPLIGLPPGRYLLKAEATGRRTDLPARLLLPTLPVSRVVEVVVP